MSLSDPLRLGKPEPSGADGNRVCRLIAFVISMRCAILYVINPLPACAESPPQSPTTPPAPCATPDAAHLVAAMRGVLHPSRTPQDICFKMMLVWVGSAHGAARDGDDRPR